MQNVTYHPGREREFFDALPDVLRNRLLDAKRSYVDAGEADEQAARELAIWDLATWLLASDVVRIDGALWAVTAWESTRERTLKKLLLTIERTASRDCDF